MKQIGLVNIANCLTLLLENFVVII